jgi:hypothetical protein
VGLCTQWANPLALGSNARGRAQRRKRLTVALKSEAAVF